VRLLLSEWIAPPYSAELLVMKLLPWKIRVAKDKAIAAP